MQGVKCLCVRTAVREIPLYLYCNAYCHAYSLGLADTVHVRYGRRHIETGLTASTPFSAAVNGACVPCLSRLLVSLEFDRLFLVSSPDSFFSPHVSSRCSRMHVVDRERMAKKV
jgi:hypothetical protein